jgi:hypothetical protein
VDRAQDGFTAGYLAICGGLAGAKKTKKSGSVKKGAKVRSERMSGNRRAEAGLLTIDELRADRPGGEVTLKIASELAAEASEIHRQALLDLRAFDFWTRSEGQPYRPSNGLWLPQRRAVSFGNAYLSILKAAQKKNIRWNGEAALIKMPTGTGKTAVIAALACCSPLAKKTLIITPRAALVRQMRFDLTYRFWQKLDALYYDCQLREHEVVEQVESIKESVRSGKICPVRVFGADNYKNIYRERDQARQIVVSTFNALHLVLGTPPPAHRSMYGREAREVAASIRHLRDDPEDEVTPLMQKENIEEFRNFLQNIDLVIVDEGHYEPAFSWAQAVRAISAPTLIFTATPYRNDYKYFKVDGNFVFNLPWEEAVRERLIREVGVAAPVSSGSFRSRPKESYTPPKFVEEFTETLSALPKGKKVIVHAGTYEVLKALQRAFWEKVGQACVLIHDAFVGQEKNCKDLARFPGGDRLKALRFQHVAQAEESAAAKTAIIWLHQFKLLEGIDDDSFIEVWLYDSFGNARQLVQQIGRAIRRPNLGDPHGQEATIRGCSKRLDVYQGAPTVADQTRDRWNSYVQFEKYVADHQDLAFIAETQLVASIKRAAPGVQYIAGEFRGGHILDQTPTIEAFQLPRRGVVCRVDGVEKHQPEAIPKSFLDTLQEQSMLAMELEERFDIRKVHASADEKYRDVRLIQYLAWSNSKLLVRHHIPEWRLGVMAIVRAGRYILLLDTEGICVDTSRLGLLNPEAVEFRRLFARNPAVAIPQRNLTRIVETGAAGLDISELGLRSITVRKRALDEGYFDLAESSQVPTWVKGFGQLGDASALRRLSFRASSVSDATYKYLRLEEYVRWAKTVARTMADETVEPHGYFSRFAREVAPLEEEVGAPKSILLDFWEILEVADETRDDRQWDLDAVQKLLSFDTCCPVQAEILGNKSIRYFFHFASEEVDLRYHYRDSIPPSGRYTISSPELDRAILNEESQRIARDNRQPGQRLPVSLTRLINQEQAFCIVPDLKGVVYAHSHFYEPHIDKNLLSILEPCKALKGVVSEKGDTRVKDVTLWPTKTLFGLVYGWIARRARNSEIAQDINGCSIVICDDRGAETADFYAIDTESKRVFMVHAKADQGVAGASARKLQDVTRQAQASLAFAGSSRKAFALPQAWKTKWSAELKAANNAKITKPRISGGAQLSAKEAYERLMDALSNPAYSKEIVMLTSGLLSAAKAKKAFESDHSLDLQFVYFLASVRSTFDRAGVRLRIIVNE